MTLNKFNKLKKIFTDKKYSFLLVVFVILACLMPLRFAHAQIDIILSGLSGLVKLFATALVEWSSIIPLLPIMGFLIATDFILGAITAFVSLFLWLVMQITISIPLVPQAGGTDMVSVGWQFTRSLANIGFVLVLAWVAFATILRIKSYQIKTILPKLLIIAVLVNFIPVITGVIIDIANVITGFFSSKSLGAVDQWLGKFVVTSPFFNETNKITDIVSDFLKTPSITFLVKPLAGIIINGFSIFIFLFYALIFIVRVVAIWILIILAPLCWLAYIIPGGKKWWTFWWNQFILWVIIGIPIFFFLYLAGYAFSSGVSCGVGAPATWGAIFTDVPTDFACAILGYAVPVLILWIGLSVSLTLAPRGSQGIIGGIKKAAKWGAITAGSVAGVAAAKYGGPLAQRMGQHLSERAAQGVAAGKTKGGFGGFMQRTGWGATGLAGSGLGWGAGEAMTWAAQAQQKKVGAAKSKIQNLKKEDQIKALLGHLGVAKWKPGGIEQVLGDLEAMDDKHNLGWALNELTDGQRQQLVEFTAKNMPNKLEDVIKHRQDLIEDPTLGPTITSAMVSKGLQDDDVQELISVMSDTEVDALKGIGVTPQQAKDAKEKLLKLATYKKAVEALKRTDIEGLTKETLGREGFQEMAIRFKPWEFVRSLIDEGGPGYVDDLHKRIQDISPEEVAKNNPRILRLPYTPAGKQFGLKEFVDSAGNPMTESQINQLIQRQKAMVRPMQGTGSVEEIIKNIP